MWRRLLDCGGRASRKAACHWHASGSTGARVAYSHAQPTPPIPGSMHVTLGSEDSMRSIPLMAATTVILAAAWACGGDGGGTGPDSDNTITTRHGDFVDGSTVDNPGLTPSHTYATAGSPTVTLTVTDNGGKSNTKSIQVTVSGTTTNTPPVASFVVPSTCQVNAACSFTDGSTDSDGTIASWSWNFGDGTAADVNQN